jgi:hypothetical protein
VTLNAGRRLSGRELFRSGALSADIGPTLRVESMSIFRGKGFDATVQTVRQDGRRASLESERTTLIHAVGHEGLLALETPRHRSLGELGNVPGLKENYLANGGSARVATPLHVDPCDAFAITRTRKRFDTLRLNAPADESVQQYELLPDAEAVKRRGFADTPIHPSTRRFGKFIDTICLLPGDLILFREVPEASGDSPLTVQVQANGGYASEHARWTHAAMYLGDDFNVIEATTDNYYSGNVRVTHLDKYCTGQFAMRIRRPKLTTEKDRLKLCVRALSRLRLRYNLKAAVLLWYHAYLKKRILRNDTLGLSVNKAIICSTLYSDAFTEVTHRTFSRQAGPCVPALLSGSDLLEDIKPGWVRII